MEDHTDAHLLHTILHEDHISPSSQNNRNNTDKHSTFFCYFSLQMQIWTYSLSNNSDYYVIKHQHDTVSLQIQIYNKGRESYHNHKHSDTQEFFSKYFISRIDTRPSMLSNGSNSIILS